MLFSSNYSEIKGCSVHFSKVDFQHKIISYNLISWCLEAKHSFAAVCMWNMDGCKTTSNYSFELVP